MGTTGKGYPYPEGTDLVMEGDDAIKALAETIDTKLPFAATSGRRDMGETAPGNTNSRTITFPVGMFTDYPIVVTTGNTSYPQTRGKASSVTAASTTSATLWAFYDSTGSATATLALYWVAMQATATGSLMRLMGTPAHDATVTCTTPGCSNEGYPIPVYSTLFDEDGNPMPDTPGGFNCGVCGADITDSLVMVDDDGGA